MLYALTILISAFLLFQVQPVIAKIILPWFGGSAAVWTVCILFFQLVLLLGYLYAHALVTYLRPRMQMIVHGCLLLASVAALPIYPGGWLKPSGMSDPTFGILGVLAVTVGLPYFLLSTTGPLVQAWYARRFKDAMPYRLYALSNAGSMSALVTYPVLFEPKFTVHQQAGMWSISYVVFILLCGITGLVSLAASGQGGWKPESGADAGGEEPEKPAMRQYVLWLLLPACASVLLLAITNHLSANVAAIPFLWVLPLSLYLLTFILCFEGSGWYRRVAYLPLLVVALGAMSYTMFTIMDRHVVIRGVTIGAVWIMVALYGLGLFTCCMVCHGELVRLKPHPRYLTKFYLMISAGGALGGILVGLIAPRVFRSFYEMPLGVVGCALLVLLALRLDPGASGWFRGWRALAPAAGVLFALAMAVYLGNHVKEEEEGSRLLVRNFYGGLRVRDNGPETALATVRTLTNGTINHGEQYLNPARRDLPTTYYGPNTGIGIAIREHGRNRAIRVGVIGLGTGTIASYGRLGDYYRFYEINPLVPRIAQSEFTFVGDTRARGAKIDIAMGDARLTLEREDPEQFDVMAVDAFSSDAIPVHLLTREAMSLYFRHLRPDGILAVHISNRYLDLQPVLAGETAATGKFARLVDSDEDDADDVFGATWVLVASSPSAFLGEELGSTEPLKPERKVRLWTDDYSNLFQILK
jgi:SAM-dependent methyltransferase